MTFDTYTEFQNASASQKVTLAIIEPARRLVGWTLDSGSVYKITFEEHVILTVTDSGVALTPAASSTLSPGEFFLDRSTKELFLRTSDSVDPNTKFVVVFFRQYYSDLAGVALPNDLTTGFEVEFLPLIRDTSEFGVSLDNRSGSGFGIAIEGSGNVQFYNDFDYWASRFDKWEWSNKRTFVYSWEPSLPATEAKLIYRGRISRKTWNSKRIRFQLKDFITELKQEIPLSNIEDLAVPFSVNDSLLTAKQRQVYGFVKGLRPTPIDQVVDGFDATGTITVTSSLKTVAGVGTTFLSELLPGDQIRIGDFDPVAIESITDDTNAVLSSEWADLTQSGVTFKVVPDRSKRFKNRQHLVAGHETSEATTTIVEVKAPDIFNVVNPDPFESGDTITINAENLTVEFVSQNDIQTFQNIAILPNPGDDVTKQSVTNVFLGRDELLKDRDYTYDAATAILTLTDTAERNVAPLKLGIGSVSWSSASRTVTGTGTEFTAQLIPGDWIFAQTGTEFLEVLSIESDTSLTVNTTPTETASVQQLSFKQPENFNEDSSFISLDVTGKTEDGTKGGTLIQTGAKIVEDLLTDAGLAAFLDTASFTTASDLAQPKLGLTIPDAFDETSTPSFRDTITRINKSILGSLFQDEDFQLAYTVLNPRRNLTDIILDESDGIRFSVKSDISKIVKTAKVNYRNKEADPNSGVKSNLQVSDTTDTGQFLTETQNEIEVDSLLIDATPATTLAQRYAFLLQLARSIISVDTKLQTSRKSVNDPVQIKHQKMYERLGSTLNRKFGVIEKLTKSGDGVSIVAEDLGNALSRAGTITANTANSFDTASDNEKIVNGYITSNDNAGMILNDPETFGINLIW